MAEVQRERDDAVRARRLALSDLEKAAFAADHPGLRRLAGLYADLAFAAEPGKGRRPFDAGPVSQHPDDRPLLHEPTQTRREQLRSLDRAIDQLCVEVGTWLGDETDWVSERAYCPNCGRGEHPGAHHRRELDDAAEWLRAVLACGPVRATLLFEEGHRQGWSRSQLRKAGDELGVQRAQGKKGGPKRSWWWALPEGSR